MTPVILREQLQKQIDTLPDDIVQQIADFTSFMMARREIRPLYSEWSDHQWQDFSLGQFFRGEDEVEYSLNDAKDIYKP